MAANETSLNATESEVVKDIHGLHASVEAIDDDSTWRCVPQTLVMGTLGRLGWHY